MAAFHKIEEALEDLKKGKIILVTDDAERENEGDFICAAQFATTENINFMATYGKGLICMENKDYEGCNTAFKKAQEILTHLTATLDRKYEVADKLAALYDFFKYQIIQSNIRKEAGPVEEILPMIKELQEVFVQADKQVRIENSVG